MSDLDFTRRIADGDPNAAEQFVHDYYPSVFRLLRHLTGHREDAEDLTQQTFITARSKVETYQGKASLRTWIHRIAFNEYGQWKRKQKRTAPLSFEQLQIEHGFGAFVIGESLLSALRTLPPKLREAFILHEVEELSVNEVAQVLGVPQGTVKARLFYARRRLRTLLEDGSEVKDHEPKEAII